MRAGDAWKRDPMATQAGAGGGGSGTALSPEGFGVPGAVRGG